MESNNNLLKELNQLIGACLELNPSLSLPTNQVEILKSLDMKSVDQLRQCAFQLNNFIINNGINRTMNPELNAVILELQINLNTNIRGRPLTEQFPEFKQLIDTVASVDKQIGDTVKTVDDTSKSIRELIRVTKSHGGWQKNRDYLLELKITETVHKYEGERGHNPGEIIRIYKKGTILKKDRTDLCQVDGLFKRNDSNTWVLCEAKSHLNKHELDSAIKTVKTFHEYLNSVKNEIIPNDNDELLGNSNYWKQVKQFQSLLGKNDIEPTIIKYLGYDICDHRENPEEDPVEMAKKEGFCIVRPTNDGYEVVQ
jgi:hypothetical protein